MSRRTVWIIAGVLVVAGAAASIAAVGHRDGRFGHRGMVDQALSALGAQRLLWACDLTMETGLAKLRALSHTGASRDDLVAMRWRNAARLFPTFETGNEELLLCEAIEKSSQDRAWVPLNWD